MTAKELNDTTIPKYDSPSEESLLPIFEPQSGITGKTALATIRDMFAVFLTEATATATETPIGENAAVDLQIERNGKDVRADFRFRIPVAGLGERIAAIESTAEAASATADEAKSTAETASATADEAKSTAETASATADEAKSTAETASATADEAKSTAEAASATADRVEAAVNEVLGSELADGAGAIRTMIDSAVADAKEEILSQSEDVRAAEESARTAADDALSERVDALQENVGDLDALKTTAKDSLVSAVNELGEKVPTFRTVTFSGTATVPNNNFLGTYAKSVTLEPGEIPLSVMSAGVIGGRGLILRGWNTVWVASTRAACVTLVIENRTSSYEVGDWSASLLVMKA